jgi:ABC-type anion transport system duplicated permease subunit
MADEKLRMHFGDYLSKAEVTVYSMLAVLLFIAALATIANAGKMLWDGLRHHQGKNTILEQRLAQFLRVV